jgi:anti-anti-sigma factor
MEDARMPSSREQPIDFAVHVAEEPAGGMNATVFGELDAATAPELREALEPLLDAGVRVVIDLRACAFVDSSGIAVLAKAAWRLKEQGRVLVVRGAHERVKRILEVAGLASHGSVVLESTRVAAEH